ncbi:hypothetical protein L1077_21750 [Pseudoalteromonas luteoviolacea]|uniref:hypothetical protein n=1 Tax=Pseudoalteromonas luteoviolacea TaxID=43657 RepID=UPI001F3C26E2|nr:hypothetical protein [Pseudoalteromonas luteoviolacea]MCF6442059.1 hypothetical protein [Pseudoalteromonas luteoviolacea]
MSEENQFIPTIDPSDTSVQDMFGQVLQQKIQDGAIEKAISAKVDGLIEDVADQAFRSYGDLGKAMEEKLTNAIIPQLEKIGDLPTYHQFVINRLAEAAQDFYDQKLAAKLDEELKNIMGEVPDEVSLSWLVQQVMEGAQEDSGDYEGEIYLKITERNYGSFINVYLDPCGESDRHDCKYDIHLCEQEDKKWKVIGLRIDGGDVRERKALGSLYRLEKILFNMCVTKATIEMDGGLNSGEYETYWSND